PEGRPRQRCPAALRLEGRARTLRGARRRMSGGEAVFVVAGQPGALGHAACPPSWLASQAAGEIIPIAECRRMVLYSSIQAATLVRAAAMAGKSSRDRSSN